MTNPYGFAATVLTLALIAGSPAGAGTPEQPEIKDPAGDANAINGQGVLLGLEEGPDTRPASIDGADLRAIWVDTAYDVVKVRDAARNILEVQHLPFALRIHVRTEAPAAPSPGPTMVYRYPATIGGCDVFFQMWVSGPGSVPGDPPQRVDIRRLTSSCPGGATTMTSPTFTLSLDGNVATWQYPISTFPALLGVGREVAPDGNPHVRPLLGAATAPEIDQTVQAESAFKIGSDVPPNIDCRQTPEHEKCQG